MSRPRSAVPVGEARVRRRLGRYELTAATDFGPRLTSLRVGDGPEILADLGPEIRIENPVQGDYVFRGGHRLWVAPEVAETTHVPDDAPCAVDSGTDFLEVRAEPDRAGFAKMIRFALSDDHLVVDHTIMWSGSRPTHVAPWAITQFPTGGVGILPIPPVDLGSGLQADRSVVLWPYSRLDDPRLTWVGHMVLIRCEPGPSLKLGSGPHPRALGYLRDGYLFTKRFGPATQGAQPDLGAVGQVFVNDDFCELESLGKLTQMEPGSRVEHRELWEVRRCADLDEAMALLAEWMPT